MTDFDQASLRTELSQEPIDDRETRELLERLTATDLGDHMPTLGAVAEATGHSIESVATQLVAIRKDKDPDLRQRVENLESVVIEHETRLSAPPAYRPKPINGPYGREHFFRESDSTGVILLFAILLVVGGFFLFAMAGNPAPKSTATCYAGGNSVPCEFINPAR